MNLSNKRITKVLISLRMRRLICTFVVRELRRQVSLEDGPANEKLLLVTYRLHRMKAQFCSGLLSLLFIITQSITANLASLQNINIGAKCIPEAGLRHI